MTQIMFYFHIFCVQIVPNPITLIMLLRTKIRETKLRWLKSNLSLVAVRKVEVTKHEFETSFD